MPTYENKNKPKRQMEANRNHSSIANCRTKMPVILREIFGILHGVSKFLSIYSSISHGSTDLWFHGILVGKHWISVSICSVSTHTNLLPFYISKIKNG
jgi:hypothetical protein